MSFDYIKTKSSKNDKSRDKNGEEILWSKPLEEKSDNSEENGWKKALNFLGLAKSNSDDSKNLNKLRKEMIIQIKHSPEKKMQKNKNNDSGKKIFFEKPLNHLQTDNKKAQTHSSFNTILSKSDKKIEEKKVILNGLSKPWGKQKEEDIKIEVKKNQNIDAQIPKKEKESSLDFENENSLVAGIVKKIRNKLDKYKIIKKDFYIVKKDEIKTPSKRSEDNFEKLSQAEEWDGVGVLNTNLIKDNYLSLFNWQRNIISLFIGVLFAMIILSGSFFTILYFEQVKEAERQVYQDKINLLKDKIDKAKTDVAEIKELSGKIRLVKTLLDNHKYWSNFFTFLENNTLPNVYYADFKGGVNGDYTLAATAKDFSNMQSQIKQFKTNQDVQSIISEGGRKEKDDKDGQGKVSFDIKLKINPVIFLEK